MSGFALRTVFGRYVADHGFTSDPLMARRFTTEASAMEYGVRSEVVVPWGDGADAAAGVPAALAIRHWLSFPRAQRDAVTDTMKQDALDAVNRAPDDMTTLRATRLVLAAARLLAELPDDWP